MLTKFNIRSNDHLSLLLFGGDLRVSVKEPIIIDGKLQMTKAGDIKSHKVEKNLTVRGFSLNPQKEWKNKKGYYKTNDDILSQIAKGNPEHEAVKFVNTLQKIKRNNKMKSTYYDRTLQNVYPSQILRGYYHHTATTTARLASDLQQIPNTSVSSVKKIYISRYN